MCIYPIVLLSLILLYNKQIQQNRIEQWSSWSVFDVFQTILKSAAKSAAKSAPLFFWKAAAQAVLETNIASGSASAADFMSKKRKRKRRFFFEKRCPPLLMGPLRLVRQTYGLVNLRAPQPNQWRIIPALQTLAGHGSDTAQFQNLT